MERGWDVTHLLSIFPEDRDSMPFHTPNLHLTPLQADEAVIADLLRLQETRGIHPCGEGGEFETLVLDGPFFRRRVEILRAERDWRGTSGVWRVREARLAAKA